MPKKTNNKESIKTETKKPWLIKKGQVLNPKGRPKGSRNKFAEEFVKDFLADWEEHGAKAIKKARELDPLGYIRVGASLIPKDFNVNMSSEKDIEKILEKFDDEQLEAILRTITAAGASVKADSVKKETRTKSDSVH